MSDEHLTDERIQEILDAQAPGDVLFLPWHAKTCRPCRERFREYQRLYAGLAVDPGFALPPGFADSVLARNPRPACIHFPGPADLDRRRRRRGPAAAGSVHRLAPLAAGSVWTWDAIHGPLLPWQRGFRAFLRAGRRGQAIVSRHRRPARRHPGRALPAAPPAGATAMIAVRPCRSGMVLGERPPSMPGQGAAPRAYLAASE